MRFVAVLLIVAGIAVVWSAIKGRDPLSEWQVFMDLLTHQHGGAPATPPPAAPTPGPFSGPVGPQPPPGNAA